MIFVEEQPEPMQFEKEVREPGKDFLERVPNPSTRSGSLGRIGRRSWASFTMGMAEYVLTPATG